MEDDLKIFKMEDDLKNFKIEDDLKNFKKPRSAGWYREESQDDSLEKRAESEGDEREAE